MKLAILPDQSSLLLFSMFRKNGDTVCVRKGYVGVAYCMAIKEFMEMCACFKAVASS